MNQDPTDNLVSLQRQLVAARENLRLIQERMADYVLSTDIPLQLVKEERRLTDRVAELEQQIAARSGRRLPADEEAAPSTLFDQRGQTVGTQINVAGDYVAQRPAKSGDADIPPATEPAKDAPADGFRYDAFISYSHKDADWVRKTLLHLERAGLRVCIDFRDFEIGTPSLVNMENAVEHSRKTLLVLTPAWVDSEWTTFEALLIQTDDPAGRARRILPLLVKRCQLPKRLGIFTYLDMTKPAEFEAQLRRLVTAIRPAP